MPNAFSCLTAFTRHLFKHAFVLLPWFAKNFQNRPFDTQDFQPIVPFLERIKRERPRLFGNSDAMAQANKAFRFFLDTLVPEGDAETNQKAVNHHMDAWKSAWRHRKSLQLRGHEAKLMKYFFEIFSDLASIGLIIYVG